MRFATLLLPLLCAACASAPVPAPRPHLPSPALVLGTFSYDTVPDPREAWSVRLERMDASDASDDADYALPVALDPERGRGVFQGVLPPGVYTFVDAGPRARRFPASGMPMPFEVQAGALRDAGHYALNPLTSR